MAHKKTKTNVKKMKAENNKRLVNRTREARTQKEKRSNDNNSNDHAVVRQLRKLACSSVV